VVQPLVIPARSVARHLPQRLGDAHDPSAAAASRATRRRVWALNAAACAPCNPRAWTRVLRLVPPSPGSQSVEHAVAAEPIAAAATDCGAS
jgi:hypothetical protein